MQASSPATSLAECAASDSEDHRQVAEPKASSGLYLVVQPVGGLPERLQAIVSAGLLAKDLGRELKLVWKPELACNCTWQRLFEKVPLAVLDEKAQEGAMEAAVELLCLWDMVCIAHGHDDLLDLAMERFNRAHWFHFHEGRASFLDPAEAKWQKLQGVPEAAQPACVCIRATGAFYPLDGRRAIWVDLAERRALILQDLHLRKPLSMRLQRLEAGTIAVDAWSLEASESTELLLVETAMDGLRNGDAADTQFFVASREPDTLKKRWGERYGRRMVLCRNTTTARSVPSAVEDELVGLFMLGRGAVILTNCLDARADVASVLGSATVQVAGSAKEPEEAPVVPMRLLDPAPPEGPFFAAGSWDDWKAMKELRLIDKKTEEEQAPYQAQIIVKGQKAVEFTLLKDSDWNKRFVPTEEGQIWGPCSKHGSNFRVQLPNGCACIRLYWDPRGRRKLKWTFILTSGQEVADKGASVQTTPYFLAGSWDSWRDFTQLASAGDGPPYRAKIPINGKVEFQVFRGRDWRQRFYPSAWGGKVCGPSSGEGRNWCVEPPAACKWLKVTWDPRGHKSLRWRFISINDRVIEENRASPSAPSAPGRAGLRAGRPALPTRINNMEVPRRLGNWRLLELLGKGYVGAVFRAKQWCLDEGDEFWGEDEPEEEEVAVKFPALACEIDALNRCKDIEGVPRMLDDGYGPGRTLFCVMPVLGPSLKTLLQRCDHDGRGGRVSHWAANALGVSLVHALRGIHGCGLVHCDVNPGNVLFRMEDCQPQLIDFGWARRIGSAHFDRTVGTCMYNSVRAGFGGQRTPADDLESVGWLVLHCILGRLPWAGRDEGVSAQQAEAWQKRSEGISVAKELFLADQTIFGPEFTCELPELTSYLQLCQAAGPDPNTQIDYRQLLGLLQDQDQTSKGATLRVARHWRHVLQLAEDRVQRETVYSAVRGLICHRPPGRQNESGTEKVCSVAKETLLRTTGEEFKCRDGGQWVHLDPVWAPKLPPALLDASWILVSKVPLPKVPWDDDTAKNGPLLAPVGRGS